MYIIQEQNLNSAVLFTHQRYVLDGLSLLRKGLETVGPIPCVFSVTWLAGDVKEPTHLPETVAPGVLFDLTLSDGMVLHIGINSLHRSRIVKEKLLRLCMTN